MSVTSSFLRSPFLSLIWKPNGREAVFAPDLPTDELCLPPVAHPGGWAELASRITKVNAETTDDE